MSSSMPLIPREDHRSAGFRSSRPLCRLLLKQSCGGCGGIFVTTTETTAVPNGCPNSCGTGVYLQLDYSATKHIRLCLTPLYRALARPGTRRNEPTLKPHSSHRCSRSSSATWRTVGHEYCHKLRRLVVSPQRFRVRALLEDRSKVPADGVTVETVKGVRFQDGSM